jgi:hypothetical protein
MPGDHRGRKSAERGAVDHELSHLCVLSLTSGRKREAVMEGHVAGRLAMAAGLGALLEHFGMFVVIMRDRRIVNSGSRSSLGHESQADGT